jgi:hypothetical protein
MVGWQSPSLLLQGRRQDLLPTEAGRGKALQPTPARHPELPGLTCRREWMDGVSMRTLRESNTAAAIVMGSTSHSIGAWWSAGARVDSSPRTRLSECFRFYKS